MAPPISAPVARAAGAGPNAISWSVTVRIATTLILKSCRTVTRVTTTNMRMTRPVNALR